MLFAFERKDNVTDEIIFNFIHHSEVAEYNRESKFNPSISRPEKVKWRYYPKYMEGLRLRGAKYHTSLAARMYLRKKGINDFSYDF